MKVLWALVVLMCCWIYKMVSLECMIMYNWAQIMYNLCIFWIFVVKIFFLTKDIFRPWKSLFTKILFDQIFFSLIYQSFSMQIFFLNKKCFTPKIVLPPKLFCPKFFFDRNLFDRIILINIIFVINLISQSPMYTCLVNVEKNIVHVNL